MVIDGQQLDPKNTDDYLKNAIYQSDSAFVSIHSGSNKLVTKQKSEQISLASFQTQTNKLTWSLGFPKDSLFGIFNHHYMSVLSSKGEIFIVDLRTGEKSTLESIPLAVLKKQRQFYLVSDDQYIMLWHILSHAIPFGKCSQSSAQRNTLCF